LSRLSRRSQQREWKGRIPSGQPNKDACGGARLSGNGEASGYITPAEYKSKKKAILDSL